MNATNCTPINSEDKSWISNGDLLGILMKYFISVQVGGGGNACQNLEYLGIFLCRVLGKTLLPFYPILLALSCVSQPHVPIS